MSKLGRFVTMLLWSIGATPSAAAGAPAPLPKRAVGILTLPGDYAWGVHFEPGFPWEWARSEGGSAVLIPRGLGVYVLTPHFLPGTFSICRSL